jgi:hypothetical protein
LAQPGFRIGCLTECKRCVPGQNSKAAETRQVGDDAFGQCCREADQCLILGEISEGQNGHERLTVRGPIAAA